MPLPEGVFLDKDVHPPASWPREGDDPKPLAHPSPGGRGNSEQARIARDGTRWCAYGDHTLDPDSNRRICDPCKAFRERFRHGPAREDFTAIPTVLVEAFVPAAKVLAAATKRLGTACENGDPLPADVTQRLQDSVVYLHSVADLMREYLDR